MVLQILDKITSRKLQVRLQALFQLFVGDIEPRLQRARPAPPALPRVRVPGDELICPFIQCNDAQHAVDGSGKPNRETGMEEQYTCKCRI